MNPIPSSFRPGRFSLFDFLLLPTLILFILCSATSLTAQTAPANPAPVITIACGDDFPPYIYLDASGNPAGLYVDYFQDITQRTGQKFRWLLRPWPKAVAALEAGEADALAGFTPTPERAAHFDFSKPLHTVDTYIFFHKNLRGLQTLEDLRGFPVGMVDKAWPIELVRERAPTAKIITYPDAAAVTEAAADGKIQVFCDQENLAAFHLAKLQATDRFLHSANPVATMSNNIGVAKGRPELLKRINDALDSMPPGEFARRERATFGTPTWTPHNTRQTLAIIAITLAAAALVFLWNWMLRRQVRLITANLRASEQRFRDTFEASTDAIGLLDPHTGKILHVNQAMLSMYGYSREEVSTLNIEALSANSPDFSQQMAEQRIQEAIRQGQTQFEWMARHRDGRTFPIDVILKTTNIAGTPSILTVARDITQRKTADAERLQLLQREQEARQQAELANASKDRFIANLSHELRTPLTPVLLTLSAWKEEAAVKDPHRNELHMLIRNVQLESRLIDDLLDITRIAQGKLILEKSDCDIKQLIHETVQMFLAQPGATLNVNLPAQTLVIHVDPVRIRQILWNLIGNARKFTRTDGHILISPIPHGDHIEITITDNGIGIDPSFIPNLFTPFVQGESGGTRPDGLGLGLPICQAIAQAHGGSLSCSSPGINQGATFTLRLPLLPPNT